MENPSMAGERSTTVEDISSYLEKCEGVAVFSSNQEDRLQTRLISLLDGPNFPFPKTLSDLDRDELRTAFAVCEATGVTREEFSKMDGPHREVCLERTISAQLKRQTVTLWHHSERCYSAEGCDPVVVSVGVAFVLNAFAKAQAALETRTLRKIVANVTRVIDQIDERFPGAVRRPARKGEGYFIRVLPASSK
jgi:hypothetical protein